MSILADRAHYRPRGAARDLIASRDAEVVIAGPAGTGKSLACLWKLHAVAHNNEGMHGLICRKTAATLSSTALVTWRRFVINKALIEGDVSYYGGSAQEPPQYRYSNGSVIFIGGLDKVSKIMSAEYDLVYVQEATELTENDWESITTRLRYWVLSYQQLMADCNPDKPNHWLKVRCDDGRTRYLLSRHEDNPLLFNPDGTLTERGADYIAKLDRLTGVRKARLRYGKWVSAEGAIYEDFSTDIHVIDEIPAEGRAVDCFGVPLRWERIWGVDFGFVNPFVLQCWAIDEDDRLYLYREIYMTHQTVDVHAREMLAIVAPCESHCGSEETTHNCNNCEICKCVWKEPIPKAIVCDHDAEGRAVLERELGINTSPAHKSVLEGIEAFQVRLKDAGDGKPRVFMLRNALVREDPELRDSAKPVCTIEEMPGYVWANNKVKDAPVKIDDHGCDAARYVGAEQDFGIRVLYRGFDVWG